MKIPFNIPTCLPENVDYGKRVIAEGKFSGNNRYSYLCADLIASICDGTMALMTNSCSSALEIAAILLDLEDGDEILMPSFSFPSTAGAFRKQGAEIVWVDIRTDSKNIDETKLESRINTRTRAIVAVHYGGISCEIEELCRICDKYDLLLIEDCAHSIGSFFNKRGLGSFGDLAVFSFHETKNIQCGEGGVLLVNNETLQERASVLHNRGTNRERFLKNQVDHYSWIDQSNNFLLSELQSAFLYDQLIALDEITELRFANWNRYYKGFSEFMETEKLPVIQQNIHHNGHLFYILANSRIERKNLIEYLKNIGIGSAFHFQPLHRAPIWKGKYDAVDLPVTDRVVDTLLRLPLYHEITEQQIDTVILAIRKFYK